MFKAWTLESSFSAVSAKFIRKFKVLPRSIGSTCNGSALKIARIVGGIPADLLNIVLRFSVIMLLSALSSIDPGSDL